MQLGARSLVIALAALVATAASWVGYQAHRRNAAAAERARLWADFSACLVGDPLAEGETLDGRFRGIEMALERRQQDEVAPADWPLVCAPQRDALVGSWAMARRAPLRDSVLVGWSHLARKRSPSQLREAFELAKSLPRVPASPAVPRPPAPARPLASSWSVPAGGFLRAPLSLAREGASLHLLSQDGRSCDYAPGSAGLRCRALRALPKGAALGFVPSSATPAYAVRATSASETEWLTPGGARTEVEPDAAALVGWPGPTPVDASRALFLTHADRALLARGGAFDVAPSDLGSAGSVVRPLSCAEASIVAVVIGREEPSHWTERYDELRVFRLPTFERIASVALGASERRATLPTLQCSREQADFAWVESSGDSKRVRRERCRSSGCEASRVDLARLAALGFSSGPGRQDAAIRAAPLGDAMALVWWSPDEAVRVVLAPMAELATKSPSVLFDASAPSLAALSVPRAWLGDLVLQPLGSALLVIATLGSKEALVFRLDLDGRAATMPLSN